MAAVQKEVEQKIARATSKIKEARPKRAKPKLANVSGPKPAVVIDGVDMAHRYRLDNLSLLQRRVLVRGLKVVLDNADTDDEFKEAELLSALLADTSGFEPTPKKKHFSDCDDGKEIEGLPEPAACPFCNFHEWTSIVTVPGADDNGEDITSYHVQCDGCFAEGAPQASKLAAAQHWNKAAKKVDYSIIESLDSVNLNLKHLSDVLLCAVNSLRLEGVAEDAPATACLEAAIEARLDPARAELDEILQKLSQPRLALAG